MIFTGGPVGGGYGGGGSYAAGGMSAGGGSYAGGIPAGGGGVMGSGYGVGGGAYGAGGGAYGAGGIPGGGAYAGGGIPGSGAGMGTTRVVGGNGSCCGPSGTMHANAYGTARPGMTGTGTTVHANPGCGVGSAPSDTGCCVGGPETSCGGVGSACFEGAGNMVTSTDWTYVGEGRGSYAGTPNYSYVGEGAGSYAKETFVTPYGCRIRPCCLLLALLSLLGLALAYFLQKPAAPVPAPVGPVGTCTLWGDPHIRTFDGIRSDYYSPGEFWIVKSDNVWIQGRYLPTKVTSGLGVTKSIAVGGPFLKGHKLRVEVRSASWDGQPVLTGFPSDFSVPGVIDMHYNNVGTLLQNGREGKALHIVHIRLEDGSPEGLRIQVNRWMEPAEGDYMNVKIVMHGQKGQDGHCGNFNANPQDDDRLQVRARVGKTGVDPKDSMYATKTPVMVANRPNINDCPAQQLEDAKTLCKQKEKKFIPSMACLIDVCFAGKGFAATG